MIGVQVTLQGNNFIIVGIYAPSERKSDFYKELEEKLFDYMDQKVILMGDLNGVVWLEMDRTSSKREGNLGKLPKALFSLVDNHDLISGDLKTR